MHNVDILWGLYKTELQKQSTVPFASSNSSCNVPLVSFRMRKKGLCFLVKQYGEAPEKQFNNLSSNL